MRMTNLQFARRSSRHNRAFTLVEILIVVVILAILAALVIPQFTSATDEARENAMSTNLWRIRQQLELYKQTHGEYPRLDTFVQQMTMANNSDGETAEPNTPGYSYGPYLRDIPRNPFSGGSTIGNGEVESSDWYYNEQTGAFHANNSDIHREF